MVGAKLHLAAIGVLSIVPGAAELPMASMVMDYIERRGEIAPALEGRVKTAN